ncbi:MAG: hypothetical protein ACTSWQ_10985 [Candidatus Thorarchaeota archaeon]
MANQKRTGKNRLSPTSVHLTAAQLDHIDELKIPQSTYIRVAVAEKIERDSGYQAAIEEMDANLEDLLKQAEEAQESLKELMEKQKVFKFQQEQKRIQGIIIEEFLTSSRMSRDEFIAMVSERHNLEDHKMIGDVYDEMDIH